MRKDLELCVAEFKGLMGKLDLAIAHKALTPLLAVGYEISMQEIVDRIRAIATEALRDQEEKESENHEDPTHASDH